MDVGIKNWQEDRQEFLKAYFYIGDSQHTVDGSIFYSATLKIVIFKKNKDKLLHQPDIPSILQHNCKKVSDGHLKKAYFRFGDESTSLQPQYVSN